jgi:hypothetical protein
VLYGGEYLTTAIQGGVFDKCYTGRIFDKWSSSIVEPDFDLSLALRQ